MKRRYFLALMVVLAIILAGLLWLFMAIAQMATP